MFHVHIYIFFGKTCTIFISKNHFLLFQSFIILTHFWLYLKYRLPRPLLQFHNTCVIFFFKVGGRIVTVAGKQKIPYLFILYRCIQAGRICRHTVGDNKSVLKFRERSYKRPWWARWEPEAKTVLSLFQGVFKPCASQQEGKKTWAVLDQ
jgi:hypothetical protein